MVHGEGSAGPSPSDLTLCHNIDFGRARFQDGPHVKVGPCGAGLCATIASPKSTVDPETGRPWTDKYNPDPAQRGRPLVGVTKIGSMKLPRLCAAAADFCAVLRGFGIGRSRGPLAGVPVLYGWVPDGPGRLSGRLYNVDNGNSYAGRLLELGPATIHVEGRAIGICGGRNMTRIK